MVTITFEANKNRSIALDEATEIGECTFRSTDDLWTINHTFVDEAYQGQGIARQLVEKIADEARKAGVRLAATCPYAVRLFEQTHDFDDLLAE
ncbi:N-acetyltransferase [Streptococcus dysgalactiae subsp. equisimilis]|uniref:GNAT family N-acetyltransferase n=1 Tax=Streptococcus dysgalactiae TaxID=1334 RepID=UPI0010CAC248|nr:GNAT family N-acetyltransferase [Streptococcus dysgalactiae]MCL6222011.1 N-acetyltransferase [Streptococcus dysgalactiae subsp. equisimilis]MEC4577971.1 GNAT family N-acetyltransferase [Streptococcus dysgalactiae]UMY68063.1 N-acetyltransferase [Streptococcus dysgalactiae subsp. equisimilis]VTT09458.1 acetyltransferase [Streptococcus dysgalactiae]